MGREKFTDKTKRRNYDSLRADKNKAKERNDYKKVAEYSNYIGELLAQEGKNYLESPSRHTLFCFTQVPTKRFQDRKIK